MDGPWIVEALKLGAETGAPARLAEALERQQRRKIVARTKLRFIGWLPGRTDEGRSAKNRARRSFNPRLGGLAITIA